MKTLVFTDEFPKADGGIAQVAYELAKQMSSFGKDIIVLTFSVNKLDEEFDKKQSFKIIRLRMLENRWFRFLNLAFGLVKALIKNKISVIYATPWFPCGFIAYFFTKFFKCPYLIINHGLEITIPQKNFLRRFLMLRTFKNAKYNFCVSDFTKHKLIELGINQQKVFFIPNGVDIIKFRPDIDCSQIKERYKLKDKKVILTVGRLLERKGHDMVIKSLPGIIKDMPNIVYLIAGGDHGAKKGLEELVKKLNLMNHVFFLGYVPDEDMGALYNACDVFVMPSRQIDGDFEGFGIVFLEANACGKPVIGGNSGGVPSAIIDGVNGLLVNPLDLNEVTKAIKKLLVNKDLIKLLGNQGRQRVEKSLSWETVIKNMMEIVSGVSLPIQGPINLIYVIDDLRIGGAQELLKTTVKALDKDKYKVTVVSLFKEGSLQDYRLELGYLIKTLNMKKKYDLTVLLKLVKLMKKEKIQIVHTHLIIANFYGRLAAFLARVQVTISTLHNIFYECPQYYLWSDKLMYYFTDKIITVSDAVKNWVIEKEKVKPDKFITIHNAIDLSKFNIAIDKNKKKEELALAKDVPLIGLVGTLGKQMNLELFLKAMVSVLKEIPEVKLLIIGDGPIRKSAETLARKLGINQNVIFYGWRRDIPEMLYIIDLFVTTPTWEGFGIVILEAMIMAKPVVSTNVGGIPEVIKEGETGFLIPPDDIQALTQAVIKLLKDRELAKQMGEAGRKLVQDKFNSNVMIKNLENLYENLLLKEIR